MDYIIHYDIMAAVISVLIYVVSSSYRKLNINSGKYFRLLTVFIALSGLTDIIATCCYFYLPKTNGYIFVHYFVHSVHIICQNLLTFIYLIFSYSFIYENAKFSRKQVLSFTIPIAIIILGVLSSPITKFAFYFDEQGNYHRGAGQFTFYALAGIYIVFICINVIRNKKILSKSQQYAIISYSVISFISALIQVLNPEVLLISFGAAISTFIIFLAIQNPMEFLDMKTQLGNRALFKKIVNSYKKFDKNHSLICFQIDGINYVNEKFGVSFGNDLISQIAEFLTNIKDSKNVFRISNTQFAMILSEDDDIELLSNLIKDRFEKPFTFYEIGVNAFIRCAICCIKSLNDFNSTQELFSSLSYAFSTIKKNTSKKVFEVSSDVINEQQEYQKISIAIENAIKNNSFDVYYQPIYSITDNSYTNMEALVRLNDSELGFISPDKFIPIAEKSGDILAIGEIVLEKVCKFVSQFKPYEFGIKSIHVNLSVVQCMQEDIYSNLMGIIQKYNLPQGLIDFEITETTADNTDNCLDKIMNSFNKEGIKFSLDDFGTGYSNQSNIMRHPYSIVKIDKSMVWSCDTNPKASISLKHTIAMIRDLEMKVLAEGVETEEQKIFLKEIGCDYLQGYYFAKPLPEKQILELLKENQAS